MAEDTYSKPTVTVLGEVTDLTQTKPGIYFDHPHASLGSKTPPSPGAPGTVS